jgi:NAD-dependent deacetylase
MGCPEKYPMEKIFPILEKEIPPLCPLCQGILRPAVIFFGEPLDSYVLNSAYEEAEKCDFLFAIGSSLVVYPAADIPVRACRAGAKLAIINKDPTPLDNLADYVINDEAGKTLDAIAELLAGDL